MAQWNKDGKETNTLCPSCNQDIYIEAADHFNITEAVCPECGAYFDEDVLECWAQTIWPYPSWDPNGDKVGG